MVRIVCGQCLEVAWLKDQENHCMWVCLHGKSGLDLFILPLAQAFVLSHTSLVFGIFQQTFRQFYHQAGVGQVC